MADETQTVDYSEVFHKFCKNPYSLNETGYHSDKNDTIHWSTDVRDTPCQLLVPWVQNTQSTGWFWENFTSLARKCPGIARKNHFLSKKCSSTQKFETPLYTNHNHHNIINNFLCHREFHNNNNNSDPSQTPIFVWPTLRIISLPVRFILPNSSYFSTGAFMANGSRLPKQVLRFNVSIFSGFDNFRRDVQHNLYFVDSDWSVLCGDKS